MQIVEEQPGGFTLAQRALNAGLTAHARARMQQRGIRAEALERLLDYGREAFDHRGHVVVYFDKAARRRVERDADEATRKELSRLARTYAVLSPAGTVVTVGHRYRRISR
jgi:hypothetical protein